MTLEQADIAQRYNIGVIITREGYSLKSIFHIKELIRWRDPVINNKFAYSVTVEQQNEPRHNRVQLDISKVEIMPGFEDFVYKKIDEKFNKNAQKQG